MRIIELTSTLPKHREFVNVDRIVSIRQFDPGMDKSSVILSPDDSKDPYTVVMMDYQMKVVVTETPEQILEMVSNIK